MSGHSKWATIKRKKGATDAARGKVFTRLTREIVTAARLGGGDPDGNPRLRKAILAARAQQMPNENIKRAIQRGTGEIEGAAFEEVLYEGTGPSGTLYLVEGMTDNRNRTAAEIRKVFEKHNGQMGGSGTAGWAFDRLGLITLDRNAATEEQLMETAVGAGADDYRDEGDVWTVYTQPNDLDKVTAALESANIVVQSSKIGFVPKARKPVSGRDAEVCLNLVDALDDHDDVQNVYADFDISDEEMQRIAAQSGA
ncbi:MAG: YebC/PmpR family DNA-binding transcriptional regulator [Pseudomonadota bacterium]|nr:MAG: YebC/PmpR family DNA-binding transcriptional regulator [Pseudomonadota bacterium]